MAFVDEITIHAAAGKGGLGVVRWRHEKGKEYAGAAGGNGGRGGSVYVRAVRDFGILASYRNIKEFRAENGGHGMRNSMNGKNGKDLTIDLPLGSIVTNKKNGKRFSLDVIGKDVLILEGGRGGLGNEHFKASTNVRPKQATSGAEGEEADFYIELELVADCGLVGLPNAGKSSLLNTLTKAQSKIGSYAFTTLEPHLGAFHGFVIADIPGLIEGASEGKGLGDKFLRHVRRTKLLLHCVSAENEKVGEAYKTIRNELKMFDPSLLQKQEIILLTKKDEVGEKEVEKKLKELKKYGDKVLAVSVLDESSIKELSKVLASVLK